MKNNYQIERVAFLENSWFAFALTPEIFVI
ncbi:MAG: hypothetical protein PWQ27_896 [Kosmotoga sp.]|nr:hypothetical protein [Kosmotoga sp.]MDK2953513.1 hypothetical protein [Kosmotoga sp.]